MNAVDGATAWLMLAAGDDRAHGGNDGYDDDPKSHYSWDDTVHNDELPQPGDIIVLRDKKKLLGASVIEHIDHGTARKNLHRCPKCGLAAIEARSTMTPTHRCRKCKHEFEEPATTPTTVKTYRTRHEAAWQDLDGQLTADQLRRLCVQPKSIHSIRELDYARFRAALQQDPVNSPLTTLEATLKRITGGHRTSSARVRLGQAPFRRHLLTRYGNECAFTGPAPAEALEAAHLYSYAATGEHHVDGGLLMRRDIHHLFDLGHLAVHPDERLIDVREDTRLYEEYGRLHGKTFKPTLTVAQCKWIGLHWSMHRSKDS